MCKARFISQEAFLNGLKKHYLKKNLKTPLHSKCNFLECFFLVIARKERAFLKSPNPSILLLLFLPELCSFAANFWFFCHPYFFFQLAEFEIYSWPQIIVNQIAMIL